MKIGDQWRAISGGSADLFALEKPLAMTMREANNVVEAFPDKRTIIVEAGEPPPKD